MTSEIPTQDSRAYAGVTDAFQRLWTPHRQAYISGESKPKDGSKDECPFCAAPDKTDEDGLIVHRGKHCFVLMNLFPYNAGHLLVCPYEHVSLYPDIAPEVRVEFGELTAKAMQVLQQVASPHGFNLGMNQGAVAGAGIAAHLHQHVVPRWSGDANFFPIVAQVKAVPQLLGEERELIAKAWEE